MKYIWLLFLPFFASANYLSIGESGEVIAPNSYNLGGTFQTSSAGRGGINVGGFVDSGWSEDMSSRFLFGVGSLDFHLGASLKYIPFPDFENQPALGLRAAFWLARIEDASVTTLQIAPMASKIISVTEGSLVSYVALPVNFVFLSNKSETGAQFTFGAEYTHPKVHNVKFTGEIGLDLNNSESGITLFASIPFDNTSGFKRRPHKD